jgi:hypothetical protein
MDAIQQFLQQEHIVVPQEFVVGGGSKVNIVFYFLMYFKLLL